MCYTYESVCVCAPARVYIYIKCIYTFILEKKFLKMKVHGFLKIHN